MLHFSAMEGLRYFQTTICLVLVLLTIGMEGRIRSSTRGSLQKIKTTLTSAGKNVGKRVDKISDYLDSEEGSSQMETVCSSLETVGGAVFSLTSGNTVEIISATLDVISAATVLIPVAGPIISTVFSLIGTIFGAIAGGGGNDVGTVVRKEIERALNKYEDSQIKAEAFGTMEAFSVSHAYLAVKEGGPPMNEHELAALTSNIPVWKGVEFLGTLSHKAKERSTETDPDKVMQAMDYLQLYATLATFRIAILFEMYGLVKTANHSGFTANAILRTIERANFTNKNDLRFLSEPDYSKAVFFAYFNPSEWPQTMAFMGKLGLSYQQNKHLASGSHYLRPQKWTNTYMVMYDLFWEKSVEGTKSYIAQVWFYFDPISLEDNVFYLRSYKLPSWYVFMTNDFLAFCKGWKGKPGPQGEWKVIRFNDGKYMLSPRKWPKSFIYMKNNIRGSIKGWNGDPGIQGHWLIN